VDEVAVDTTFAVHAVALPMRASPSLTFEDERTLGRVVLAQGL
jgi:hypothetical protein